MNKGLHRSQAFNHKMHATHLVCCASKSVLPKLLEGSRTDTSHP